MAPSWIPEAFRSGSVTDELAALQEAWPELVARCELLQPALRTLLRDSWPVGISEVELTVGFDPEFANEVEEVKLLDHGALHRMFSEVLGRSIRVGYSRLLRPVSWSHVHQEKGEERAEEAEGDFDAERAGNDARQWQRHPKVRQVLEVFNGDILDVQPRLTSQETPK